MGQCCETATQKIDNIVRKSRNYFLGPCSGISYVRTMLFVFSDFLQALTDCASELNANIGAVFLAHVS